MRPEATPFADRRRFSHITAEVVARAVRHRPPPRLLSLCTRLSRDSENPMVDRLKTDPN